MSQLFFLTLISCTFLAQGMEKGTEIMPYNRQKLQAACTQKLTPIVLDVLQYDPAIRLIIDTRSTIIHQRLSVFVHGFGGSGNCVKWIQTFNPSDYITFHLPDYKLSDKEMALSQTSFGGENEIIPLIYVLNMLRQNDISAIDIVGLSRGCAVVINTLAALLEPSKNLMESLKKLDIGLRERNAILELIVNGTITLWHPLRDVNSLIENVVANALDTNRNSDSYTLQGSRKNKSALARWWDSLGSSTSQSCQNVITRSIQYGILPALTAYQPWAITVNKSLEIFNKYPEFQSKIMILLQPNDTKVGNTNEGSYIEALPAQKKHTYIVVGTTPGHLQHDRHQFLAVNAFRKEYGASYINTAFLNSEILKSTNVGLLVNTYQSIQNFLDTYYQNSTIENKLYQSYNATQNIAE